MNKPAQPLSSEQLLEVLTLPKLATAIHVTEDAIIQYANDAMLAVWGKGKGVIGKSLEDALPELKGQPFIDLFKQVWNEGLTIAGTSAPAELVVDGTLQTFYFDYEYRAIKNAQGEVYCILHTAADVTERVLSAEREQNLIEELRASNEELTSANEEISAANEELNASNEELSESQTDLRRLYDELNTSNTRFQSLIKQAPVGICVIQVADLFITDVNDAYLELVGKQRSEFADRTIWEAVPEAAEAYAPVMNEVITSGIVFEAREHELILIRNGVPETVFVDFVYEPLWQDETVYAIMVLAIEVTEKVIARHGIEDMEERARLAAEAAETGTFDLDLVTNIMLTSDRFNHIFGYDHHVDRKMFADVIHPDDRNTRETAHENALITGRLYYDVRVIHPDDSIHWIRVQGKVYYDNENKPLRILGTLLDITEQVNARDDIQKLNEELAATNEELAATNEELAMTNEEQMSTNEELVATVDELWETQENLKKSKADAQESESALQFALQAAQLATFDLNPLTNRFRGNTRLKHWFGLDPDEEIELPKALAVIAEQDRDRVVAAIQDALTYRYGGHYDIEYTIINPLDPQPRYVHAKGQAVFNTQEQPVQFSGTLQDITEERRTRKDLESAFEQARLSKEAAQLGTFDMDLVAGTLEWDDRCRLLFGISHQNTVSYENDFLPGLHPDDRDRVSKVIDDVFVKSISNGDYDVEYRTVGAEDGKVRWVRAKGKTFFNDNDEPIRFIGSVLEITDQKEDEIRKSTFIGMVSHELKTPLTSLKAYIQLLGTKAKKENDGFAAGTLGKVEIQVNKMTTMINGFLNLSRLEAGKIQLIKQPFDLEKLIKEVIEETTLLGSTHVIKLLPFKPVTLDADRDKIDHVIANFVSNAIKYSAPGSRIVIACVVTSRNVRVSVKDEGIGIKPHDISRLFERFYRVENPDSQHISGFGIGLYLSAEIIERHNGKIGVDSEVGKGSTFWFTLPINP